MPSNRSFVRTLEVALALLVGLIALVTVTSVQPYPTWPTVGPLPVNPELVVPGLLGVVALVGAVRDGLGLGSLFVGVLAALTVYFAVTSLYTLVTVERGGVFFGGLFTLVSGSALAFAVVVRALLHWRVHRDLVRRVSARS